MRTSCAPNISGSPLGKFRRAVPFALSLVTTTLSMATTGLLSIAAPWLLISGGRDAAEAGLAAFAVTLPVALGALVGGGLVDRYGARATLTASNLAASAAAAGALAVALADPDALVAVAGMIALVNLAATPGGVAQDSAVRRVARLGRVPLERANGLRDLAVHLGQGVGPAAGVLIVEAHGLTGAVAAAAALSAVAALLDFAAFPADRRPRAASGLPAQGGFATLAADRMLATVAGLGVALVAAFSALDEMLAPALAVEAGLGAEALSLFLATASLGALVAAAGFAAFGHRLSARDAFGAGIALTACGFVILAAMPPETGFLIAPAVMGLGAGALWPIVMTAVHRRIPHLAAGAAVGSLLAVVLAAQPLAALAAGPFIDAFGARALAAALAALAVAAALHALFSPSLAELDR